MREKSTVHSPQSTVRGVVVAILFLLLTVNCQLLTCYADAISSTELIEHAKDYDGKTIEYQGEAVGDVMVRGNGAWLNVYDGENAIGIWSDAGIKERITRGGSYKFAGDTVLLKGEFHRACPAHGGDLDIHAADVHILKRGSIVEHPVSRGKLSTAIFLAAVAGCFVLVDLLWKRK